MGGCDEDLFKENDKDGTLPMLFIQPNKLNFLQQLEGSLLPLVDFLISAQSVYPVSHWELFESHSFFSDVCQPVHKDW